MYAMYGLIHTAASCFKSVTDMSKMSITEIKVHRNTKPQSFETFVKTWLPRNLPLRRRGPAGFPEGLHPSYPAVLVENCVKASFKYEDQNQHGMNLRRGASAEAPRMTKVNAIRQTCQPINPEDESSEARWPSFPGMLVRKSRPNWVSARPLLRTLI